MNDGNSKSLSRHFGYFGEGFDLQFMVFTAITFMHVCGHGSHWWLKRDEKELLCVFFNRQLLSLLILLTAHII